jgi:Tfp pilus assembly protein PilN
MPVEITIPKDIRKLLRFGSGIGIEIRGKDLEVAVVRVRPTGIRVLGRRTIAAFESRPASEWGAEYTSFLKSMGASYLSATVLLPRNDVISRLLPLPGVAAKDMESAIQLQLDSLHPYGDEDVAWGWVRLRNGAALVGIARRSVVDRYEQIFAEAGISLASFTFSASALHGAVRLNGAGGARQGFLALRETDTGSIEAYGESETRALFSAEFDVAPGRAAAIAASELRLEPELEPVRFEDVLPKPNSNPAENDLSRNALPYATALAGACPRLAPAANMLPPERRSSKSRVMLVPTIALAILFVAAAIGGVIYSRVADKQYLERLNSEIARLRPQQERAIGLDRETAASVARTQWLDSYRAQTRKDLEMLNELTRLIEPPAWTSSISITRDSVRLQGEAPQATALWKILDGSNIFNGAKLDSNQSAQAGGETFFISGARKVGGTAK